MRNRFLCLCLALVMVLPFVLGSCTQVVDPPDVAAPVYTLYCITGDTTTDEAITKIEYELNRTLFYRIGSIVKLEFATADEYHDLIESKKLEISDYVNGTNVSGTNEKEEKKSLVNFAKLSESAKAAGYEVMTGEAILSDLEAGIPLELESPRLDLFLITDYQEYLKMAENGDLAALDTVLSNEAKAIKSVVHSSFFNAAKVNNKTYGVPCNTAIGEYTYVVFDRKLLEESNVALETLKDMDDLSDYLAIVKKNNPDIIPLANSVTPWQYSYMFVDGFAAYVNASGNVRSTYEDAAMNSYFSMLARYNSLGYFENKDGKKGDDESVPFAVKFVTGTKEDVEALAKANDYVYNTYCNPIATSENSIDCIYGVSILCPSSWITQVMEILTELYVDDGLQNTLLYGIEGEHYRLEGSQVVRKNKDYMMSYKHTGNCFIAYTDLDAGDSVDRWLLMRDQNIDATESKTIGFNFLPKEFVFGTYKNEEGVEVEWKIAEPDYQSILWTIIEPYYTKLMDGTAIEFDYLQEEEDSRAAAMQSIYDELFATYELRLNVAATANVNQDVTTEFGEQFRAEALAKTKELCAEQFESSSRKRKLTKEIQSQYPDLSEEEVDAKVEQLLVTPDEIWEYRTLIRKEAQWENEIESQYQDLHKEKVAEKTQEILNSEEYLASVAAIPETEEFKTEYDHMVLIQVDDTVSNYLDNTLSGKITEYCDTMIAECEVALENAITLFAEDYAKNSKKAYEDGVRAQLKKLFPSKTDGELDDLTKGQLDFIKTYAKVSSADKKYDSAFEELFAEYYPDVTDDQEKDAKLAELKKIYTEVYLPLYSDFYNGTDLALVEIGYLSRSVLETFGDAPVEEGEGEEGGETEGDTETETPEEPGEDVTEPGQYESYYKFVIEAKFQAPYYAQFGTNG